ncbi:hypothetical protein N7454_000933 [Penicillium verhagenii]|uniref:uncharacterized protein n=1 Tax=Penicillium verhagenii TaxID=1562060 RepID=UPI0025459F39|nr:uncharacterized protein N7466_004590 [Penicillium verhagenii]KAJ5935043.1 hypothetical protein N7466_004590 [Penicillium verhagenii]KAJ5949349.1 hypothetical protein N7454_000933 [Penicillium verhagenii]
MPLFSRDSTASASSSSPRSSILTHSSAGHKESSRSSFSSRSESSAGSHRRRSILHRTPEDPSIQTAREQVLRAETAEQEADRALILSRRAVKEARDHVKRLEREASEEARLAKIKHDQAKSISKRAKPLGRHM